MAEMSEPNRWEKELAQFQEVLSNPTGQAIVIVGPEGSGKSTLLRNMVMLSEKGEKFHVDVNIHIIGPGANRNDVLRAIGKWPSGSVAHLDAKIIIGRLSSSVEEFGNLHRRVIGIDANHTQPAALEKYWLEIIPQLPEKVKFIFTQRPNDILATNKQFMDLSNVVRIDIDAPPATDERIDGKGRQEGQGKSLFEQEIANLEERDTLKFSLETKSIMKVAIQLAVKEGENDWKLTTREILAAIAFLGKRKEKEYKTAQFVLEKLRSNRSDFLEDYFNRSYRETSTDKKIKGKVLKRTGYVGDALREAKKFAISTTSTNLIQIRHLLASLLLFRAAGKETPGAHNVVKEAGIELPTFMREFQQYVKNTFKDDKTDAWEKIFGEKVAYEKQSVEVDIFGKKAKQIADGEAEGEEVEEDSAEKPTQESFINLTS